MRISDIVLFTVKGKAILPTFPPGDRQVRQLDIYPEHNLPLESGKPAGGPREIRGTYVEVQTGEGVSGIFGPIEEAQAFVIQKSLRPFLIGTDPLATETRLDQMLRLWDLKGKAWGQPVYRLLGGPTRESVPAYASMLGFSLEPEAATAAALEYKDKGFTAQKWFFRHGPGDSEAGMAANLALARVLRDTVGPHYPLMFDAFMGWDLPYAVEMVKALAAFNPTWMEEPVPPERVGALRKIREAAGVPVATGEHVYTRWQVKELLAADAVDVIQTDPDWTGGITELTKIAALASAFEIPLVAHGHSLLPALHVAASQSSRTVPFVEFLIRGQETKQALHTPIYRPEKGSITLPDLPGLGLVLDDDRIEDREPVRF